MKTILVLAVAAVAVGVLTRSEAPTVREGPMGNDLVLINRSLDDQSYQVAQLTLKCGIPPIPPDGCKVGECACDSHGQNCKWTIVCK